MPTAETLSPALPRDIEMLASKILARACDSGRALATAESCTGGLLSSLLTDIEGASHAFDRGFVVYSEAAKADLLDVEPALIERCGAVSAEVAAAMAKGAIAHSRADIAVAVTGFAGPAEPGDEAGLVHFACATRAGGLHLGEEHFGAIGRGPVRIAAIRTALTMVRDALGD